MPRITNPHQVSDRLHQATGHLEAYFTVYSADSRAISTALKLLAQRARRITTAFDERIRTDVTPTAPHLDLQPSTLADINEILWTTYQEEAS